ncbi:hypothetical protein [Actinokineospora spheciospongiae]|uniref:hypothetical protein n=1 Tax=Actinokineospora spheciospongiae TaxID=909613 RepID=UPI0011B825E4|nr:hypothetical protein [Actinokineospora spheciospongiae]
MVDNDLSRPRTVECRDACDRERQAQTWADPVAGTIVLRVPPGEVALLSPQQARRLRDDLDLHATLTEVHQTESKVRPSMSSPGALRAELVASGWELQGNHADDSGPLAAHHDGDGYRDFAVMDATGTGYVFLGRWFAASNLTWIRQADGWQEAVNLLEDFPDHPADPWVPADVTDLLAALEQRQAECAARTAVEAVCPPSVAPRSDEPQAAP